VIDSGHPRERVDETWIDLAELVDSLGPGGLETTGSDGWAVKDHLVHVGAWERFLLGIFDGEEPLTAMGLDIMEDDTDAINAAVWSMHRERSADDALAYFRESHAELVAKLESLSDSDLQLPYATYQPASAREDYSDRPVIDWVGPNTYEHYLEHIDWIKSLISQRIQR
jgi:uncharacterized protein (TIGR03083 family)